MNIKAAKHAFIGLIGLSLVFILAFVGFYTNDHSVYQRVSGGFRAGIYMDFIGVFTIEVVGGICGCWV